MARLRIRSQLGWALVRNQKSPFCGAIAVHQHYGHRILQIVPKLVVRSGQVRSTADRCYPPGEMGRQPADVLHPNEVMRDTWGELTISAEN